MNFRAIALFSGGLDSLLAVKIIMGMDIEVEGITFETPFFSSQKARMAAKAIGLPLSVIDLTAPHLIMLKAPRYGYGKNMNPCIDCHTLMLKTAGAYMETAGADFILTGEVLGQRPMSQTRQSLHLVAKNSGYGGAILRPLSARLLPETKPERERIVDRTRLLAIQGRGRKTQMELARHYGIADYAPPAGGCLLTDPNFSRRLRDLFDHQPDCRVRDVDILKFGRHFRIPDGAKIIVGRNQNDNEAIQSLIAGNDVVIQLADVAGPTVLVPDGGSDEALAIAATLCVLYSGTSSASKVLCKGAGRDAVFIVEALSRKIAQRMLI
jgi:tRNA U34 2-thiouridine synthase MnmA/TrmU